MICNGTRAYCANHMYEIVDIDWRGLSKLPSITIWINKKTYDGLGMNGKKIVRH